MRVFMRQRCVRMRVYARGHAPRTCYAAFFRVTIDAVRGARADDVIAHSRCFDASIDVTLMLPVAA